VSATVAPHLANRLRAIKASRLAAEDRVAPPPGEGPKLLTLEARRNASESEACMHGLQKAAPYGPVTMYLYFCAFHCCDMPALKPSTRWAC
jgi:hypothetical protein